MPDQSLTETCEVEHEACIDDPSCVHHTTTSVHTCEALCVDNTVACINCKLHSVMDGERRFDDPPASITALKDCYNQALLLADAYMNTDEIDCLLDPTRSECKASVEGVCAVEPANEASLVGRPFCEGSISTEVSLLLRALRGTWSYDRYTEIKEKLPTSAQLVECDSDLCCEEWNNALHMKAAGVIANIDVTWVNNELPKYTNDTDGAVTKDDFEKLLVFQPLGTCSPGLVTEEKIDTIVTPPIECVGTFTSKCNPEDVNTGSAGELMECYIINRDEFSAACQKWADNTVCELQVAGELKQKAFPCDKSYIDDPGVQTILFLILTTITLMLVCAGTIVCCAKYACSKAETEQERGGGNDQADTAVGSIDIDYIAIRDGKLNRSKFNSMEKSIAQVEQDKIADTDFSACCTGVVTSIQDTVCGAAEEDPAAEWTGADAGDNALRYVCWLCGFGMNVYFITSNFLNMPDANQYNAFNFGTRIAAWSEFLVMSLSLLGAVGLYCYTLALSEPVVDGAPTGYAHMIVDAFSFVRVWSLFLFIPYADPVLIYKIAKTRAQAWRRWLNVEKGNEKILTKVFALIGLLVVVSSIMAVVLKLQEISFMINLQPQSWGWIEWSINLKTFVGFINQLIAQSRLAKPIGQDMMIFIFGDVSSGTASMTDQEHYVAYTFFSDLCERGIRKHGVYGLLWLLTRENEDIQALVFHDRTKETADENAGIEMTSENLGYQI